MLDRDYVRLMAEYNAWMNEKIYDACARLSDDERKRDRGAFFGSLHNTLNHLVWADRRILARLRGEPVGPGRPSDVLFDDFSELRQERARLDAAILEWARQLPEGSLAETFVSNAFDPPRRMPRSLIAVQLFNHQTHHRGQVTTLLSQLGVDIGSTDLPASPHAQTLYSPA